MAVGLRVKVTVGAGESVFVQAGVEVSKGVAIPVAVSVGEAVTDSAGRGVNVGVEVELGVGELVGVSVLEGVAVGLGDGVAVGRSSPFKNITASPANGEETCRVAPPSMEFPLEIAPVAGFSHSTKKVPGEALRSIVAGLPFGKYIKYSAPAVAAFARQ